jgi:hypothetical protein
MSNAYSPSVTAVAVRSLLIGVTLAILLVLVVGRENVRDVWGPILLAYWISGIVGGYMMAWTRPGLRRWAWATVGSVLLVTLIWLFATPVGMA